MTQNQSPQQKQEKGEKKKFKNKVGNIGHKTFVSSSA